MRVKQIDHITLVVRDLEASRKFYVSGLGMEIVPRPNFDFEGEWYRAGETLLHTILSNDRSGAPGVNEDGRTKSSRGHHFAFSVENAEDAARELKELGVEFLHPLKKRPDGAMQVFVLDPDGHVVEICSL